MPEPSDEAIASQVQRGEPEAFAALVERYEAKLTRYARRFLFDREDAQDMVQEAFIKAYINIQSFNVKKKFSSWMYRIAHNEFINALKKKKRHPVFSFDFDALIPHPLVTQFMANDSDRAELRRLLDAHLDKLDPKYKAPLVLYYFEELDYEEIADILKLPHSTVGVRLRRGRIMLKRLMESGGKKYD